MPLTPPSLSQILANHKLPRLHKEKRPLSEIDFHSSGADRDNWQTLVRDIYIQLKLMPAMS
jgi:hypothetical protein